MTLDKHKIDGLPDITSRTMLANEFDRLMTQAGYSNTGEALAKGNRVKLWWTHREYRRVEAIYSPDKRTVITAYHP